MHEDGASRSAAAIDSRYFRSRAHGLPIRGQAGHLLSARV
jgi:hypothetical protein